VTQPGEYLKRVYYNPSNGFFCTAYSKGKFAIYKLLEEELTEVQTFSVGENKISTLAVNSSASWVCLGLKTYGQIIVWEWKSQSYILNQKGFIHETQAVHFNKHKLIATGTNDGKVKVWDKVSGFCLATF
jgi:periodic tryptophan protein 2